MRQQDAWRRRANLYGCASASRLPTVHVEPTDARVRRDLQLAVAWHNPLQATASGFEAEQNDRKHREQLGQRPPLDRLQALQDLTATVPRDLRPSGSPAKQGAWRVGYNNHAHCEARAHPNGLFEPSETMRERVAMGSSASASCLTVSRTISYPLTPASAAQVAESMYPFDERVAREEMDRRMNVGGRSNNDEAHDCHRAPWSPNARLPSSKTGSPSKIGSVSPQKQRLAVRSVATKPCTRVRATPQEMDGRCIGKQQRVVAQANETFARIRKKVDRHKKAALRYSLPLEDSTQGRSYRLGLDAVPSSHPAMDQQQDELTGAPSPAQPHKFRPKSAAATGTLLGPSRSTNALEPEVSVGKVAGAKRRPHSASVCYLRHSTVYCLDTAAANNNGPDEPNGANPSDYQSLLANERRKRSQNQSQLLQLLAKRGMLSHIPMPQIFARLRREALVHLTRRQQHAMYEKMPLHEYMKTCGFSTIVTNRIGRAGSSGAVESPSSQPATDADEDKVALLQGASRAAQFDFRTYYDDGTTPSIVFLPLDPPPSSGNDAALHRQMLVVNRQQCHIAMEPFSLSTSDVNLLFSSVDVQVEDSVALWKLLCAVATIQTEHAAMRRARVQHGKKNAPVHADEAFVSVLRGSLTTATL